MVETEKKILHCGSSTKRGKVDDSGTTSSSRAKAKQITMTSRTKCTHKQNERKMEAQSPRDGETRKLYMRMSKLGHCDEPSSW